MSEQENSLDEELAKLPFKIGDLVTLRSKDKSLLKFSHLPQDDVGIILDIKKSTKYSIYDPVWIASVHWQKYKTKKGDTPTYKIKRLKKVRKKKEYDV
jgi:hypothetical protein